MCNRGNKGFEIGIGIAGDQADVLAHAEATGCEVAGYGEIRLRVEDEPAGWNWILLKQPSHDPANPGRGAVMHRVMHLDPLPAATLLAALTKTLHAYQVAWQHPIRSQQHQLPMPVG